MCYAGRQAADHGELFLSPDLFLHLDQFGNILENKDDTMNGVPVVPEQRNGRSEYGRIPIFLYYRSVKAERALHEVFCMAKQPLDTIPEDVLPADLELRIGVSGNIFSCRVAGCYFPLKVHREDPAPHAF